MRLERRERALLDKFEIELGLFRRPGHLDRQQLAECDERGAHVGRGRVVSRHDDRARRPRRRRQRRVGGRAAENEGGLRRGSGDGSRRKTLRGEEIDHGIAQAQARKTDRRGRQRCRRRRHHLVRALERRTDDRRRGRRGGERALVEGLKNASRRGRARLDREEPARESPARTQLLAERGRDRGPGHAARLELRRERRRAAQHLAENRRGDGDDALARQRLDRTRVESGARFRRELGAAYLVVHREDVADLLPRDAHVPLLVRADHLRAEPGRGAVARVEVQSVDPARRCDRRIDALDRRVPAAVDRRRDERIVVTARARVGGRVQHRHDLRHEVAARCESAADRVRREQRAFHRDGAVRRIGHRIDAEPRFCHVEIAHAHTRVHRPRHELAHERFEVSADTGAKAPFEVDREFVGCAVPRPGRTVVGVAHRVADTRLPSELECGHQESGVRAVRVELARRDQSRVADVGVRRERGIQRGDVGRRGQVADGGIDVDVSPGPFLAGDGKDVAAPCAGGEHERRSDAPRRIAPREFVVLQHREHEPRREPMRGGIRRDRRVAPRKVLVVEIDGREIVRLEIAHASARLGADHLAGLYAHHVARSGKLHGERRRIVACLIRNHRERDGNARAARARAGGRTEGVADAPAQPRQECVARDGHLEGGR